jgi:hypothetical protein
LGIGLPGFMGRAHGVAVDISEFVFNGIALADALTHGSDATFAIPALTIGGAGNGQGAERPEQNGNQ